MKSLQQRIGATVNVDNDYVKFVRWHRIKSLIFVRWRRTNQVLLEC